MKKKYLNVVAALGCFGVVGTGMAAGRSGMYSNIDMRNSNGDTIRIQRGYGDARADDYSYVRRTNRSGMYNDVETTKNYKQVETTNTTKRTYTRGETYKTSAKRKYFIANPFYQPLKGQFGSVTTGEYMEGKYKFADVNRKLTEFSLKEDLSYGLTDRIALQGMAKYDWDKLTWENSTGDKDEYKSDGLNLYGFGVQGRIIDTNKWISTLSGYYEHQKHGIDYFIADFKAGYKIDRTTIYGLGRGWLINMDGDIYGDYMEDATTWGMLVYGSGNETLFMGELGAGVWNVLSEDWTLNVEGLYGFYDWHNQLSIKGALGWQPNDFFALNLYAKTSLYDTADDKVLDIYEGNLPLNWANWESAGTAKVDISKYREWSVGLQVMFQF